MILTFESVKNLSYNFGYDLNKDQIIELIELLENEEITEQNLNIIIEESGLNARN